MPTRSSHPYLLGESSKLHTTLMDFLQLAALITEMNTKLDILKEIRRENEQNRWKIGQINDWLWVLDYWINSIPSWNYRGDNTGYPPNLNDQFLKSIKIDVPNFDGHHDP